MANRDDCRNIVRQLWPFLDGALPDTMRDDVTKHLEGCTNCRSHFEFERAFLDAVRLHGIQDQLGDLDALAVRVHRALAAEGLSS